MATELHSRVVLVHDIPNAMSKKEILDLLSSTGEVPALQFVYEQDEDGPMRMGIAKYFDLDAATTVVRNYDKHEEMGRKLWLELIGPSYNELDLDNFDPIVREIRHCLPPPSTPQSSHHGLPQASQQDIAPAFGFAAISGSSAQDKLSTTPGYHATRFRAAGAEEVPFNCRCGKKFATHFALRRHQGPPSRAKPEKCGLADTSSDGTGHAVHPGNGSSVGFAKSYSEVLKCERGQSIASPSALQHHQDNKAESQKRRSWKATDTDESVKPGRYVQPQSKNLMCGCGRKFATLRAVNQHQERMTESEKCQTWENIDPEQAVQLGTVSRANGSKAPAKPFKCGCGRKFALHRALKSHQNAWADMKCQKGNTTFKGKLLDPAKETAHPLRTNVTSERAKAHWTRRGTGKHLQTILPHDIQPSDTPVSSKDGYQVLGSYNWSSVGRGENVYFVPGAASVWKDLALPLQLPPDTELPAMDSENAQDLPTYPYQASLEAIKIMNPGRDFNDIDVLTDWKVLRNLLYFAIRKQGKAFRVKLYLVKKTLIIEMRSEVAETWCSGNEDAVRHADRVQYGRSMEPTFGEYAAGLEQSEAHIRIIQYNLGSLSCAVRFQADSCYTGPKDTTSTGHGDEASDNTSPTMDTVGGEAATSLAQLTSEQPTIEDLTLEDPTTEEPIEVLPLAAKEAPPIDEATRDTTCESVVTDKTKTSLTMSNATSSQGTVLGQITPTQATVATAVPNIIIRGGGTPQTLIGEVKTRAYSTQGSEGLPVVSANWLTQLWLNRIPKVIIGRHFEGLVQHIQHHDLSVDGEWEEWEEQEENQVALRKLVALLCELRSAVAEHSAAAGGHGAFFAVSHREEGVHGLRIFKSEEDRDMPLPEYLIKSLWSVDK